MFLFRMMSCLLLTLVIPVASQATVQMTFPAGTVEVSGATPGGNVVLFGTARQSEGWLSKCENLGFQLTDPEQDGTVALQTGGQNAFAFEPNSVQRSVWVAVDLTTGEATVDSPEMGEVIESDAEFRAFLQAGQWHIEIEEQTVDVVVVRPGVGAWGGQIHDGATNDLSPDSDGKVMFPTTELQALPVSGGTNGSLAALGGLLRGDMMIFIDSQTLEYQIFDTGAE